MKTPRSPTKIGRVGRKRRAAGWTLLGLGVTVAAVWVASGWWQWCLPGGNDRLLLIGAGRVNLCRHAIPGWYKHLWDRGLEPIPTAQRRLWMTTLPSEQSAFVSTWNCLLVARFDLPSGQSTVWNAVLWPVPLLLCTPAALLLRSGIVARRRAVMGFCTACGYSLAGLGGDATCPECGR